jgi:hypothetical protein
MKIIFQKLKIQPLCSPFETYCNKTVVIFPLILKTTHLIHTVFGSRGRWTTQWTQKDWSFVSDFSCDLRSVPRASQLVDLRSFHSSLIRKMIEKYWSPRWCESESVRDRERRGMSLHPRFGARRSAKRRLSTARVKWSSTSWNVGRFKQKVTEKQVTFTILRTQQETQTN